LLQPAVRAAVDSVQVEAEAIVRTHPAVSG
jgi:hypothetical protein